MASGSCLIRISTPLWLYLAQHRMQRKLYVMPSSTKKQAKTMQAAAHNPAFAAKIGIPVKVAKEFNKADQAKPKKKK